MANSENKPESPDRKAMAQEAMDHWTHAFVDVLESMTQYRSQIVSHESPSSALPQGSAWWAQGLSLLEEPCFWIGSPADSWTAIGRLALSALGVEDASDTDIQATCRDVMAQTSAIVATQITRKFGEEVTGRDSVPSGAPDPGGALVFGWSLDAGQVTIEGYAVWSAAFLDRCMSLAAQLEPSTAGTPEPPPASHDAATPLEDHALDSFPKVDLRVKFVLGRATMLLKDIFKLNIGSVIELDRNVVEPADVVIGGRVFARGQVVVVNGSYGLKILAPKHGTRDSGVAHE
jgi:flagellar motor switch protein FliN/FliY